MLKFSIQSFLSLSRWPHYFSTLSLCLILQGLYYVVRPFTFQMIFDEITGNRRLLELSHALGLLGGLLICMAIGVIGQEFFLSRLSVRAMNDLRARLFQKMQSAPPQHFDGDGTSKISGLFSADMNIVETAYVRGIPPLILHASVAVLCVVLLFWIEWRLAVATFLALPIAFLVPKAFAKKASSSEKAYATDNASLLAMVQESALTHSVVRLFDLVTRRRALFGKRLESVATTAPDATLFTGLVGRSAVIGTGLTQLLVIALGAYLVIDGSMTAGLLIAFVALLGRVSDGVSAVTTALPLVIPAVSAQERIDAFLATPTPVLEDTDAQPTGRLSGELRLENVRFGHRVDDPVFDDLSLKIGARQRVAIVGTSGSGKSTVIGLLLRLYRTQRGGVFLDDREIGKIDEKSLRSNINIVPQVSQMFDATVRENIICGRPDASEDEMIEAAKAAAIHDTIIAKPEGYGTRVTTGSGGLSGGERQRLSIARALLRDTPILLLDEATSALDPATEEMVSQSIADRVHDRTVVSVTHRLGSVAGFDHIFVLDGGSLIESGTHEELLARRGLYGYLWDKQHGFNIDAKEGESKVSADRLKLIPFLAACRPETLTELARYFLLMRYPEGTTVIKQGDVGDWFFIVAHGNLMIRRTEPTGEDSVVESLTQGDFFGELALVNDEPRAATIVATSDSLCLALPRQHFLSLMQSEQTVRQNIETAIARIQQFNAEAEQDQSPLTAAVEPST